MGHNSTYCPEIQLSDQSSSMKCLSAAAIEQPIQTVNLIHVSGLSQLIQNPPYVTHLSQSERNHTHLFHFFTYLTFIMYNCLSYVYILNYK